jgi:hypothetical protein
MNLTGNITLCARSDLEATVGACCPAGAHHTLTVPD